MVTSTCTETSRSGRQLQGYDDWIWPLCARNAKGIRLPATRCPWAIWHIQPIAFRTVLVEQFYAVAQDQCVYFVWQGEHHMEIFHLQTNNIWVFVQYFIFGQIVRQFILPFGVKLRRHIIPTFKHMPEKEGNALGGHFALTVRSVVNRAQIGHVLDNMPVTSLIRR